MKVSYNWLQEYLDFTLPPVDILIKAIGAQLGEVESVEDLGAKYQGVIAVKIVESTPIEDSDHLSLCLIDDGQAVAEVERNYQGLVQVVCGAPNVRPGLTVAWLPPGSTVPSSFGHDPFVLGSRKLRGHISNGMLASQKELALGDNHEGILEIDAEGKPGDDFALLYKLNDFIIDIENKMFTHRPDCFGIIGVAREVAGILGQQFKEPDWYQTLMNELAVSDEKLGLTLKNEVTDLVPRFMAAAISGITVKSSPVYLQSVLQRVGIRSINNIVDTTNYFMHLTGQPLHAYDYDKVKALSGGADVSLIARQVRPGEKLTLLNGKDIEPREGAIVIANASQVIGLAGVMGGADTEVDDSTKNIILESATFDMYSIRRTSMVHGLFSEAVTRFNKGQSPYQNDRVLAQAAKLICSDGGQLASEFKDESSPNITFNQPFVGNVKTDLGFINSRLGSSLSNEGVTQLLTNVGFKVAAETEELEISTPFWRTDIAIPEDIVEEVGRLYSFDKLPLVLPQRSIAPAGVNNLLNLKSSIRHSLSRAGANEVLTYSFVHGKLLDKVGQSRQASYKLTNALSPDLQYYRQTLTPSLLDKVNANIRSGFDHFALFEIGKTHVFNDKSTANQLPEEIDRLSFVFAADAKAAKQYHGAAFFQAKIYLDALLQDLGVSGQVMFENNENGPDLFAKNRCAAVKCHGVDLGIIGEYGARAHKSLKLPDFCSGFELDIVALLDLQSQISNYRPLPKFPKSTQDICLRVPVTVTYAALLSIVEADLDAKYGQTALIAVTPVDIFQRDNDADFKQITFRISLSSYQKTLTDDEVTTDLNRIAQTAADQLKAERV